MDLRINGRLLQLRTGDITAEAVDAIVNAANSALAGGGGVDGAIHRAGGPAIMQETASRYPSGCPAGGAVVTAAGNLRARFVIHAVGPIWRGGTAGEAQLLRSAYEASLQLAAEYGCRSIALPALSTGAYGYPLDQASRVALRTAAVALAEDSSLEVVRFVLFSSSAYAVFAAALGELQSEFAIE